MTTSGDHHEAKSRYFLPCSVFMKANLLTAEGFYLKLLGFTYKKISRKLFKAASILLFAQKTV